MLSVLSTTAASVTAMLEPKIWTTRMMLMMMMMMVIMMMVM